MEAIKKRANSDLKSMMRIYVSGGITRTRERMKKDQAFIYSQMTLIDDKGDNDGFPP